MGCSSILLSDLYPVIGCSCIETVAVGHGLVLLVDESGKIKDPPQPLNPFASRFYRGSMFGDFIHGTVVFCNLAMIPGDYEFDLYPLTSDQLSLVELVLGVQAPDIHSGDVVHCSDSFGFGYFSLNL